MFPLYALDLQLILFSIVTVLSNHTKHLPCKSTSRYDRKSKKMVKINQPNTIHFYNQTMGGVDLFDNAINNHRIAVRGKKWYWPLITNILDAAMVNAWKLHCLCRRFEGKNIMTQLDFKAFAVQVLLKSTRATEIVPTFSRISKKAAANAIRFDRVDHLIKQMGKTPQGKVIRNRCKQCKSTTATKCVKCNVPVHKKCFETYHTPSITK